MMEVVQWRVFVQGEMETALEWEQRQQESDERKATIVSPLEKQHPKLHTSIRILHIIIMMQC